MKGLTPVKELRNDCINKIPVNYDWSSGYGEDWEVVMPDPSEWNMAQCKEFCDRYGVEYPDPNPFDMTIAELATFAVEEEVDVSDPNPTLLEKIVKAIDEEEVWGLTEWRDHCQDWIWENPYSWEPMMNYYYPLPGEFDGEDAAKIDHLPLCIVHFLEDDSYALALTGGGMNLSWEICEAHMRLGYLPPTHFRLPRMAGTPPNERNRWIIDGCIRSAEISAIWAKANEKDLIRLKNWMRKEYGGYKD